MTPEEEAQSLIDQFKEYCFHNFDNDAEEQRTENARQCALIAVKYRIEAIELTSQRAFGEFEYYQLVQQQLEKP